VLGRLRAFLRLRWARTLGTLGLLRLLAAMARGGVAEVWVGDSHSVLLNAGRFPSFGIAPVSPGRWVWHLGPRVMFSIARNDLPPALRRLARIRWLRPGRGVAWFFVFGEIDIRCHLGPRMESGAADLSFVDAYVERVHAFVDGIGAAAATVVVPVPPSVDVLDHAAFPVAGSFEVRLAAHQAVRDRLVSAAAIPHRGPIIRVLDLTEALADPTGLMLPEFTDDGCHTNDAGRTVVRRAVTAHLR
jgi:hypothetical protein